MQQPLREQPVAGRRGPARCQPDTDTARPSAQREQEAPCEPAAARRAVPGEGRLPHRVAWLCLAQVGAAERGLAAPPLPQGAAKNVLTPQPPASGVIWGPNCCALPCIWEAWQETGLSARPSSQGPAVVWGGNASSCLTHTCVCLCSA